MSKGFNITNAQTDQLKEITNIGAGNAATALSHMIGQKVGMSVPESFVGDLLQIERILGGENEKVVAVFLKMYGDIDGAMLMIFKPSEAVNFIKMLTGKVVNRLDEIGDAEQASLTEMGNILLGASITALGKFLNINILHTIPDHSIDMLGSIMDSVLIELGHESEQILAFKVRLQMVGDTVGGELYYLFDSKSTQKIFDIAQSKVS